eukprot:s428_g8.t1
MTPTPIECSWSPGSWRQRFTFPGLPVSQIQGGRMHRHWGSGGSLLPHCRCAVHLILQALGMDCLVLRCSERNVAGGVSGARGLRAKKRTERRHVKGCAMKKAVVATNEMLD